MHIFFADLDKAKLHLELAQLFIIFRNVSRTDKHSRIAQEHLGFKMDLVGVMGKRTRYQCEDKAQLVLTVTLEDRKDLLRPTVKDLITPNSVSLNDDTRLENISFANGDIPIVELPNTEQKLLLTVVQQMWFSKPFDELHTEELTPYITYALAQKNTWCVRTAALLVRCRLEVNNKRTKERTLTQCEEVINCFSRDEPHALARVGGVYNTGIQPIWETEGQYADMMFKMGLIKAALDVYLRTSMWEEVIGCYSALDMRHQASKIIKQQLQVQETVKLWCWLGMTMIPCKFSAF